MPEKTLTHLWRWPVKGLGGEELSQIDVAADSLFPFDRAFAIENGPSGFDADVPEHVMKARFVCMVNQTETGRIGAAYDEASGQLMITTLDGRTFSVDPNVPEPLEEIASELVTKRVRGTLKLRHAKDLSSGHGFTDIKPRWVSLQNKQSIEQVEAWFGEAIDPRRLRANMLIEGFEPFEEEDQVGRTLMIGKGDAAVELEVMEPINRCRAIDVNPATSERDTDLLPVLRGNRNATSLGIYARVVKGGRLAPGMPVRLAG